RGVMCSVTAASVEGRFGRTVRQAALTLIREDLAHNLASDAHDPQRRPPMLARAVDAVDGVQPALGSWLVDTAPNAVLTGRELPARLAASARRPGLGSLFDRLRR